MADFSLIGIDELMVTFKALNNDVRKKSGRYALRKAANIVAGALKSNAQKIDDPQTARSIADNVAVRFSNRTFKKTGNLMFRVGIRHGAVLRRGGDVSANAPTPHWRLIEFGTQFMPARPFARPALENNVGLATNEFIKQFRKAVARAVKRAAKARSV